MPPHNKLAAITTPIDAVVGAIAVIIGIVGNKDATVELNSRAKPKKSQYILDNTGQHDAATFNKSLKNVADYLQLELGNDVSEAVRNMTDTTITIPAAPTPTPDPKDPKVMIPPSNINIFPMEAQIYQGIGPLG